MKPLTPEQRAKLKKVWEEGVPPPKSAQEKSREFQASEKGRAGGSQLLPQEEGMLESDVGLPQEIEKVLPEKAILPASIAGAFLGKNPKQAIKTSKNLFEKLRKEGIPIAKEALSDLRKTFRSFGDDLKALYKNEDDFVEKAAREKFKEIGKTSSPVTKMKVTPGSKEAAKLNADKFIQERKLDRSKIKGSGNVSPDPEDQPILETWSKKIYGK